MKKIGFFLVAFLVIFSCQKSSDIMPEKSSYWNLPLKGYNVADANLEDFKGEVIFLNFWASWCPPCRMEMPSIQALYDKYKGKVRFVMIAMEKREGAMEAFMRTEKYTFPVYTPKGLIAIEIKPDGYPTTLVIDKQGNIVANEGGAADWNAPSVHKMLDSLLEP